MRRRFMFASALATLTVLAPAVLADQEISTETTTPVATSTAGDGGGADNIVITSSGRVTLTTNATAVTLDSDNTVSNAGQINITTDSDDAVGIRVVGGTTGTVTNTGRISITSDTIATDTDSDGNLDGAYGAGSNRVAILVDGTEVFTGDIITTAGSTITVRGDNSAGIRILTGMTGNLTAGGRIQTLGDYSTGVQVRSDITGDFTVGGSVIADGIEAAGVTLDGDVGGRFAVTGVVTATGYRFAGAPAQSTIDVLDDGEDNAQGSSAIRISGSVGQGVYFNGPSDDDTTAVAANIRVRGSAPTVHFTTTATSGDIVIGEVVIPAVEDNPDTADTDESQPAQLLGYSFVNRGTLNASGELPGVSTEVLRVEGGNGFTTTLTGGIQNRGTMQANTLADDTADATATVVTIGAGAIVPVFQNLNDLNANTSGQRGTARGLVVEAGGTLNSFVNVLAVRANGLLGGSAVAILDQSGTLTSIENRGRISARHTDTTDAADQGAYSTVAIDLSAGTADSVIRQYRHADDDADKVISLDGDVLFGSGDDHLIVETGPVQGAVSFGDGADRLTISGDGGVTGVLSDSDGDLVIQVDDGSLNLAAGTNATIREARFGDGSTLRFQVDHENQIAANISSTGTITFEAGSRVSSTLANLIGDGATYVVLSANNLVIEESLQALQDTNAPYLYQADLERDPNDLNTLVLTLRRRTASELGMNSNQSAAYAAAYAGWQSNTELGAAIASLTTQTDFFSAYDQLLPEYAASAIQFALASNDSALGALATRLESVRRSPDDTAGLWVQEFGYFADRAGTAFGPGYRGQGMGLAAGFDRPWGPFYALGVNVVGAASEISEVDGSDKPMSAISAQVGMYAGADLGGLNLDLYGGVGGDWFEHDRQVVIGTYSASPRAEWTGYHFATSARIGRDFTAGRYFFRPSVSVDHLTLFESGYTETGGGDGIDLIVDDRDSSVTTGTALFTFGARFENAESWWGPHLRVGYRNEFASSETETMARFNGYNDAFTLRSTQMPGSGFVFGFGVGAGSGYSTFSFDYDADVRDDFVRHTARLVMRMVF